MSPWKEFFVLFRLFIFRFISSGTVIVTSAKSERNAKLSDDSYFKTFGHILHFLTLDNLSVDSARPRGRRNLLP
jgi:hypothetical protein